MSKVIGWNCPSESRGRPPNLSKDLGLVRKHVGFIVLVSSVSRSSAELLHFVDDAILQGVLSRSTGARFILSCFVLGSVWFVEITQISETRRLHEA